MSDGPVLKQTIRYVGNALLTRERFISAQKEELFERIKLTVDASDVGVGAVLLQERKDDIDLPNCYFS
jgi:hypothetical protein